MKHSLDRCKVCGSDEIIEISETVKDNETYAKYRCNACGEVFDSLSSVADEIKNREIKDNRVKQTSKGRLAYVDGQAVYQNNKDACVLIHSKREDGQSIGTGFIVSEDGYVVTNAHVVTTTSGKSDNLSFKLNETVLGFSPEKVGDGLDIVNIDAKHDLALLKFAADEKYQAVAFADSEDVSCGERVFAMGNSKGEGLSITEGIISDDMREVNGEKYIMSDVAVNSGNSGGPLFNAEGKVIGVVTCMKKDAVLMNYCIPSKIVEEFIERTKEAEEIDIQTKK